MTPSLPATPVGAHSGRRATPLPPEERRSAIIDAVVPLLIERGDTLTTRDIARAAGVAEGTLFNVFADKDELLAAAVEAAIDPAPLEAMIVRAGARSGSGAVDRPVERLVAVIEVLQQRSLGMFRLMSTVGHRHPGGGRKPLPLSPALVAYCETSDLPLRVDPERAAQVLRSLAFARSSPFLTDPPDDPAEIARLFLHGVAASDPSAPTGEAGS